MNLKAFTSFAFMVLTLSVIDANDEKKAKHFKKLQNWHVLNLITYAVICGKYLNKVYIYSASTEQRRLWVG